MQPVSRSPAPHPPADPWQQARTDLREGRIDRAVATYQALLQRNPQQAAAWHGLSDADLRKGRLRAALEHAGAAATALHASGQWALLPMVALRLLSLGEYRQAAQLIRAAPDDHSDVVKNRAGLAQLLGLCECHADALALLDAAGRRLPDDPQSLHARATTLRHLGRLDEATAAYERCIALAPGHVEAHWALASHQRSGEPGARVPRLRQLAARVPPDSPAHAFVMYALFKELDAAGDEIAAWQSLQAGMRSRRRQLRFDDAAEQRRYEQLMALCSRDFVTPAAEGGGSHTPIFIVGLPRTGTTVLERILGSHSRVQSAGELGDFHMRLCWEADLPAPDILDARLLEAAPRMDFARLGAGYLQRTGWRSGGKDFVLDKFPANLAYAGLIRKALPDARIVCLRRNPMDSIFSNLKELFSGNSYPHSYDPREMASHCVRASALMDHWSTVMPEAFLVVDYERLATRPDEVAREVMRFCGLEYEPASVDIRSNSSPSATASSSQVREGIHRRGIDAWRRYAGPLQEAAAALPHALRPIG